MTRAPDLKTNNPDAYLTSGRGTYVNIRGYIEFDVTYPKNEHCPIHVDS